VSSITCAGCPYAKLATQTRPRSTETTVRIRSS